MSALDLDAAVKAVETIRDARILTPESPEGCGDGCLLMVVLGERLPHGSDFHDGLPVGGTV